MDITKALRDAHLEDFAFGECLFTNFAGKSENVPGRLLYIDREASVKYDEACTHEERQSAVFTQGKHFDIDCGGKQNAYDDPRIPAIWYWINNPNVAGALGLEMPAGIRCFVTSGRLSGCGIAALRKDDKFYFIHAGASGDRASKYDCRNIPNDICNIARYLSEKEIKLLDPETPISFQAMGTEMCRLDFRGVIMLKSEKDIRLQEEGIVVRSYNHSGNVLMVVNEMGKCQVMYRKTKDSLSFENGGVIEIDL